MSFIPLNLYSTRDQPFLIKKWKQPHLTPFASAFERTFESIFHGILNYIWAALKKIQFIKNLIDGKKYF